MTKMKCDCKVVCAGNPGVPENALSKRRQTYVIGGNLKKPSCKSIQRGWLMTAPLKIIGEL